VRICSVSMITFEARCRSGNYLAAVVPISGQGTRTGYQVLVFQQGNEVYDETEQSLEEAIETAKAYLDWRAEQDFDS
jgi:uncharacterized protein YcgI (DUF1989 family)